ncbi:MAG: spore germination protein [Clostridia bacterium]|jgi:germination protein YpeB|nr:spore germination protein [Clostridia bacterium]MDN5376202.1 spore germination protein [Thermacetogenium sp.]
MTRRLTAAIVALAVLWGVTAFWGVTQVQARRRAETLLVNKYNRAFYESLQRSKNVEALLSKGLATASPEHMDTLFSDLWYNANAAQENLLQLPLSHQVVARTAKFLTQVGDYAYSITKRDQGEKFSEQDRQTMRQLYERARSLNRELATVERQAADGRFRWTEVREGLGRVFPRGTLATADTSFRRVDSQLQELPVLIYDGPFSDHLERAEPLGLTGNTVTEAQARKIARRFIDFKGAEVTGVKSAGTVKGKIPAYSFEFSTDGRQENVITANVAKKGGHVVYYINPRSVDSTKIDDQKGLALAQEFLKSRGIEDMVPTYTLRRQNILTVSFAYRQGDVIVYPDLIKVQVALDNGQILGYDALGFLMSHHRRDLPEPALTADEARQKLNPQLKVLAERMAVVPTSGKHEVLTYEFKAEMDGETFLVYINAQTGQEEHIFKLLETPAGTLVL